MATGTAVLPGRANGAETAGLFTRACPRVGYACLNRPSSGTWAPLCIGPAVLPDWEGTAMTGTQIPSARAIGHAC